MKWRHCNFETNFKMSDGSKIIIYASGMTWIDWQQEGTVMHCSSCYKCLAEFMYKLTSSPGFEMLNESLCGEPQLHMLMYITVALYIVAKTQRQHLQRCAVGAATLLCALAVAHCPNTRSSSIHTCAAGLNREVKIKIKDECFVSREVPARLGKIILLCREVSIEVYGHDESWWTKGA